MKTKNKKSFEMKILTKILQQNRKSWEYKRKDGNIKFDYVTSTQDALPVNLFQASIPFYTPKNVGKTIGFLILSRGIEMGYWFEMG